TIGKKGELREASKGGLESSFHNLLFSIISPQYAYAKEHAIAVQHGEGPKIVENNSNLKIETVFKGDLESPTSMAFLGPNDIFVFLYYTQSGGGKNGDDHPKGGGLPVQPLGNRLYRYEFDNHSNKLINPKLLLDLPATTYKINETDHNGGRIVIGPDNNVYVA